MKQTKFRLGIARLRRNRKRKNVQSENQPATPNGWKRFCRFMLNYIARLLLPRKSITFLKTFLVKNPKRNRTQENPKNGGGKRKSGELRRKKSGKNMKATNMSLYK